jgi:hypothetical protein
MFKRWIVYLGLLLILTSAEAQDEFDIGGRVLDSSGGGRLLAPR